MEVRAAFREPTGRIERVWEAREAALAEESGEELVKDMILLCTLE